MFLLPFNVGAKDCFDVIAFHLDLRVSQLTYSGLIQLANSLSDNGFNTLIIEYESTFPYNEYPYISNKNSYSENEIKSFINYCDSLKLDVIPLQQTFGHLEYILQYPVLSKYRESKTDYSQLCPSQNNIKFVSNLIGDLVSYHSSNYFHIGGDETKLLGMCSKCSNRVDNEGEGGVFYSYINDIINLVIDKYHKIPIIWGDMVLKYPKYYNNLPKKTIILDWNYGWKFNPKLNSIIDSGYTCWGAAAMRSSPDNFYNIDIKRHFDNLFEYYYDALNAGFQGFVLTSWATSGKFSYLYQSDRDIVELLPIRRVYPIQRDIFFKYVSKLKKVKIKPIDFIQQYFNEKFGFDTITAKLLAVSFYTNSKRVSSHNSSGIEKYIPIERERLDLLEKNKPKINKAEYRNFVLLQRIKVSYFELILIEKNYYLLKNNDKTRGLNLQVKIIGKSLDAIDKEYIRMFKGIITNSEIMKDIAYRRRYFNTIVEKYVR